MDSFEINENICRICLEHKVVLNWDEEIFDLCGITYRDCYYKYTQLKENVEETLTCMLCEKCSTDLKNTHFMVENALESYKYLTKSLNADLLMLKALKTEEYDRIVKQEFEESTDLLFDNEEFEEIINLEITPNVSKETNNEITIENNANDDNGIEHFLNTSESSMNPDCSVLTDANSEIDKSKKQDDNEKIYSSKRKRQKRYPDTMSEPLLYGRKRILMCAYCSQLFGDTSKLKKHEDICGNTRERKVVCVTCGLKLYDDLALVAHMKTHIKNRERDYKCEFCVKAFFSRGALNVHRRIHLGLMLHCTLCPKEFYRQTDLDNHMKSHSDFPINTNISKTTKFLVHCKQCDRQIISRSWKAHQAAHKNEPQLQCKICNKDFYSRKSCSRHINRLHNKTREEYDKYIHYYVERTATRSSLLMLKQQETVQPA